MAQPRRNPLTIIERVIGDREPFALQLSRNDGTPLDLSSASSVVIRAVKLIDSSVLIDSVAATIVAAATGSISYSMSAPEAALVTAESEYALYVLVTFPGVQPARFPYDGARFVIHFKTEVNAK